MKKITMNKTIEFIFILCFLFIVVVSCAKQNQTNSSNQTNSGLSSVNLNTSNQNNSKNIDNQQSSDMKEAKSGLYSYLYKLEGERAVAIFAEKFLPRDDKIVVNAIKDVIKRAYNEDTIGTPSLISHNGLNKIHLNSKKNDYYIILVKEDTGEVHSLVIEKESK